MSAALSDQTHQLTQDGPCTLKQCWTKSVCPSVHAATHLSVSCYLAFLNPSAVLVVPVVRWLVGWYILSVQNHQLCQRVVQGGVAALGRKSCPLSLSASLSVFAWVGEVCQCLCYVSVCKSLACTFFNRCLKK